MKKLLFICHGNICRSPMAEYIMKSLCPECEVASAAVSREEIGNDMDPRAKRCLDKHHIPYAKHKAHQVTNQELEDYDLILYMDSSNAARLPKLDKIKPLLDREVSDPWYTGDFETCFNDLWEGCQKWKKEWL